MWISVNNNKPKLKKAKYKESSKPFTTSSINNIQKAYIEYYGWKELVL